LGAVGLYVQVVAAGIYAWLLLGEHLAPVQIAGGVVVLAAIALARGSRRAPRAGTAVEPLGDAPAGLE
jgi:drug/metabolite transporter (DMT)-like permease